MGLFYQKRAAAIQDKCREGTELLMPYCRDELFMPYLRGGMGRMQGQPQWAPAAYRLASTAGVMLAGAARGPLARSRPEACMPALGWVHACHAVGAARQLAQLARLQACARMLGGAVGAGGWLGIALRQRPPVRLWRARERCLPPAAQQLRLLQHRKLQAFHGCPPVAAPAGAVHAAALAAGWAQLGCGAGQMVRREQQPVARQHLCRPGWVRWRGQGLRRQSGEAARCCEGPAAAELPNPGDITPASRCARPATAGSQEPPSRPPLIGWRRRRQSRRRSMSRCAATRPARIRQKEAGQSRDSVATACSNRSKRGGPGTAARSALGACLESAPKNLLARSNMRPHVGTRIPQPQVLQTTPPVSAASQAWRDPTRTIHTMARQPAPTRGQKVPRRLR